MEELKNVNLYFKTKDFENVHLHLKNTHFRKNEEKNVNNVT